MDYGLIVAFSAIGGNVLLGIGLAITWQRNGRSQATNYGELKNEVKNTGDKVDTWVEATKELGSQVSQFQTHCAGVSGRLDERVHATEREIKELKSK